MIRQSLPTVLSRCTKGLNLNRPQTVRRLIKFKNKWIMMIECPYSALNFLFVRDVQCNTPSSWQCTDTIPPWFWWSGGTIPFEMKYFQTWLVICFLSMQWSIISEQQDLKGQQENSGVNCDNRDEIIVVVAATGRQKHGVILLLQCNLVFYCTKLQTVAASGI